jgi:hypothetical protein
MLVDKGHPLAILVSMTRDEILAIVREMVFTRIEPGRVVYQQSCILLRSTHQLIQRVLNLKASSHSNFSSQMSSYRLSNIGQYSLTRMVL